MYYNFVRIHQTLRVTPAMAAGVTDRVWEVADIVKLIDEKPEKPNYGDAQYGSALGYDFTGHGGGIVLRCLCWSQYRNGIFLVLP